MLPEQPVWHEEVALLAEGVDRNWKSWTRFTTRYVALLAEGVDRNILDIVDKDSLERRPPRGGRG